MNYKVYFDNNKASHCKAVKDINDTADYSIVNNVKIINSLVVNALSEKEALAIGTRLAEKLTNT
ncbi:MAG TPA: hypothetical protein VGI61_04775 [Parafilimonas sp.]|jgi:hypothetical protein